MTPYILLAFANDHDGPARRLRNLPEEWREIQEALRPAVDAGRCRLIELPFATAGGLIDAFQRDEHRGRIALLHFAGHADSYRLLLESAAGAPAALGGAGLAELLGHAGGLQLVFLNGCATQGHVRGLLDAGVPAVISTSRAVDDAAAREFAARFYRGLGQALGLREAFEQTVAAMRSARPGTDGSWRHLYAVQPEDEDRMPWELSVREGAERVELWTPGTPPLPPVPPRDLPERPFRHLQRFTGEHAGLFFGREREIWELYGRVAAPDAPPVVLLYGQAGVGKSSLLEAGLLPRLEGAQEVRYVRRDPALGLLGTLARAVGADTPATAEGTAAAWRRTEAECGRPLLVILDQVEEAFTRAAEPEAEVAALAGALGELFRDRERRPRGKLVLGFRKEWLAEIENALREAEVPRKAQLLPRLSREGVIAAITGVERSRRLREHYGLSIEEGLPERIAADLLRDEDSHLAPLLQILLYAMWEAALRRDREHPRFDGDLYEALTLYRAGQEGRLLLDDFLGQQLTALGASHRVAVGSGLALDFLAFHTTRYGTAREQTVEEGAREYPHQGDVIAALRGELTDLYLLTDSPSDDGDRPAATRLAHDTLAPLVRRRFEESVAPGQRARRIVEARVTDWTAGRTGTPLDEADLAVVETGAEGMRAWTDDERRLVDASRDQREQERRARRWRRNAAVVAAALVLASSVFAFVQWRRSAQGRAQAESQVLAIQADQLREAEPELSLLLGVAAYERSPTPEARAALGETLAGISPRVRTILRSTQQDIFSLAAHPGGRWLATGDQEGEVILWDVDASQPIHTLVPWPEAPRGRMRSIRSVAFSHDGKWLATRGPILTLWDATGLGESAAVRRPPSVVRRWTGISAFSFSPDSRTLAVLTAPPKRGVVLWDLQSGRRQWYQPPGVAQTLAFSPDGALAIGRGDGTILLVRLNPISIVHTVPAVRDTAAGGIHSLAFSPDGRFLAVSTPGATKVLDTAGWIPLLVRPPQLGLPGAMVFASDSLLFAAGAERLLLVNVARTGEEVLEAHRAPISSVATSRDRRLLASVDYPGMTVLWELAPRRPWRAVNFDSFPRAPRSMAMSPSGGSLAITDSMGATWLDLVRDRRSKVGMALSGRRTLLAFSSDERSIAFVDGIRLFLWDLEAERMAPIGETPGMVLSMAHHENRIATASSTNRVHLLNERGEVIDSLDVDTIPTSVVFTADGRTLAIGTEAGGVSLWNPSTGEHRKLESRRRSITGLAFDPDGRFLAASDIEGAILLWDLTDESPISSPLTTRGSAISVLAFSRDGSSLASGKRSGVVELWDVRNRRLVSSSVVEHNHTIKGLAFRDEDRVLVSADDFGMVTRTDVSPAVWIRRACRIASWEALKEEWIRRFPAYEFPRACRRSSGRGEASRSP